MYERQSLGKAPQLQYLVLFHSNPYFILRKLADPFGKEPPRRPISTLDVDYAFKLHRKGHIVDKKEVPSTS